MLKNREYLSITLPIGQKKWLLEQAEREYITKGRLIERLLDEYRERLEQESKGAKS